MLNNKRKCVIHEIIIIIIFFKYCHFQNCPFFALYVKMHNEKVVDLRRK